MGAESPLTSGPPPRDAVLAELDCVLAGAAFRGSKRSQEFLRFIVRNALDKRSDMLKERSIGAEVFGRRADYDTGDDSIVRVKASEVRRRLAQHYMESGAPHGVQIELPPGSYTPEFRSGEVPPPPAARPRRRYRLAAAGTVLALLAAAAVYVHLSRRTALDRFWDPVTASPQPVILCVAHPVVYTLSPRLRQALQLPPGERPAQAPVDEIVRDPDHFVGVGDAMTVARLAGFFGRAGKATQIRVGTDTTFTDLRNSPAVLIGAYSNQWTMQVANDLRFVFDRDGAATLVRDRMNPAEQWVYTRTNPPTDYVIVSRIFDSRTGGVLITAAGLSHFGTQAAGEFLTNPGYFEQAVGNAPADWPRRNLQLVLRAEVIGKTPGPPKVLASYFW